MTKAETLRALADVVEKASGPSYQLDCDIWDVVYPGEREVRFAKLNGEGPYRGRLGPADRDGYVKPLRSFTASLDTAMTLVPEDAFWRVGHDGDGPDPSLFKAIVLAEFTSSKPFEAVGVTPALALTAAALRAQTQEAEE